MIFVENDVVTFVLSQFKSKSRVILPSQPAEGYFMQCCSKNVLKSIMWKVSRAMFLTGFVCNYTPVECLKNAFVIVLVLCIIPSRIYFINILYFQDRFSSIRKLYCFKSLYCWSVVNWQYTCIVCKGLGSCPPQTFPCCWQIWTQQFPHCFSDMPLVLCSSLFRTA